MNFVNVLPSLRPNQTRTIGDVQVVLDNVIGRKVFRIGGKIPAANYFAVSLKPKECSFPLNKRFCYIQYRSFGRNTVFHFDINCYGGFSVRFSFSTLVKEVKVTDSSVHWPLFASYSSKTARKWTILALDFNSIIEKCFPNNSYSSVKGFQFCSSLFLRSVALNDTPLTFETLPRDIVLPIKNVESWKDAYEWVHIHGPFDVFHAEPVVSTNPAQVTHSPVSSHGGNLALSKLPSSSRIVSRQTSSFRLSFHRLFGCTPPSCPSPVFLRAAAKEIIYAHTSFLVFSSLAADNAQRMLSAHSAPIATFALSPSQRHLVSCEQSKQCLLKFWDIETALPVALLPCPLADVSVLKFNLTGTLLLAIGVDARGRKTILLYELPCLYHTTELQDPASWPPHPTVVATKPCESDVRCGDFSPFTAYSDGYARGPSAFLFVTAGNNSLRLWRLRGGELHSLAIDLRYGDLSAPTFTCLAFERGVSSTDPAARRLFLGSTDGHVYQVAFHSRAVEAVYNIGQSSITALAVSEAFVITGARDGLLKIWHIDFRDFLLEAAHEAPVLGLGLSDDGLQVAVHTHTAAVGVLDIPKQQYTTVARGHQFGARTVAFDPHRGRLLSGCESGLVKVWNVDTGAELAEFSAKGDTVLCGAFYPEQDLVAVGYQSGCVRVFALHPPTLLFELPLHNGPCTSLIFDLHGQRLFTAGKDGNVMCMEVVAGDTQGHLHALKVLADILHPPLPSLAYSTLLDRMFASGPDGRTIVEIDLTSFTLRTVAALPLDSAGPIRSLAPHPARANTVFAVTCSGQLHVFDVGQGALIASLPASADDSLAEALSLAVIPTSPRETGTGPSEQSCVVVVGRADGFLSVHAPPSWTAKNALKNEERYRVSAGGVASLAVNPTHTLLAAAGAAGDGGISLWSVLSPSRLCTYPSSAQVNLEPTLQQADSTVPHTPSPEKETVTPHLTEQLHGMGVGPSAFTPTDSRQQSSPSPTPSAYLVSKTPVKHEPASSTSPSHPTPSMPCPKPRAAPRTHISSSQAQSSSRENVKNNAGGTTHPRLIKQAISQRACSRGEAGAEGMLCTDERKPKVIRVCPPAEPVSPVFSPTPSRVTGPISNICGGSTLALPYYITTLPEALVFTRKLPLPTTLSPALAPQESDHSQLILPIPEGFGVTCMALNEERKMLVCGHENGCVSYLPLPGSTFTLPPAARAWPVALLSESVPQSKGPVCFIASTAQGEVACLTSLQGPSPDPMLSIFQIPPSPPSSPSSSKKRLAPPVLLAAAHLPQGQSVGPLIAVTQLGNPQEEVSAGQVAFEVCVAVGSATGPVFWRLSPTTRGYSLAYAPADHRERITSICPIDDNVFAMATATGAIEIWSWVHLQRLASWPAQSALTTGGEEIEDVQGPSPVTALRFDPSHSLLLSGHANGSIILWALSVEVVYPHPPSSSSTPTIPQDEPQPHIAVTTEALVGYQLPRAVSELFWLAPETSSGASVGALCAGGEVWTVDLVQSEDHPSLPTLLQSAPSSAVLSVFPTPSPLTTSTAFLTAEQSGIVCAYDSRQLRPLLQLNPSPSAATPSDLLTMALSSPHAPLPETIYLAYSGGDLSAFTIPTSRTFTFPGWASTDIPADSGPLAACVCSGQGGWQVLVLAHAGGEIQAILHMVTPRDGGDEGGYCAPGAEHADTPNEQQLVVLAQTLVPRRSSAAVTSLESHPHSTHAFVGVSENGIVSLFALEFDVQENMFSAQEVASLDISLSYPTLTPISAPVLLALIPSPAQPSFSYVAVAFGGTNPLLLLFKFKADDRVALCDSWRLELAPHSLSAGLFNKQGSISSPQTVVAVTYPTREVQCFVFDPVQEELGAVAGKLRIRPRSEYEQRKRKQQSGALRYGRSQAPPNPHVRGRGKLCVCTVGPSQLCLWSDLGLAVFE